MFLLFITVNIFTKVLEHVPATSPGMRAVLWNSLDLSQSIFLNILLVSFSSPGPNIATFGACLGMSDLNKLDRLMKCKNSLWRIWLKSGEQRKYLKKNEMTCNDHRRNLCFCNGFLPWWGQLPALAQNSCGSLCFSDWEIKTYRTYISLLDQSDWHSLYISGFVMCPITCQDLTSALSLCFHRSSSLARWYHRFETALTLHKSLGLRKEKMCRSTSSWKRNHFINQTSSVPIPAQIKYQLVLWSE